MINALDPRYCFSCDRPLDGPVPDHGRIRRCPDCEAGLDVYRAAIGDLSTVPPPRFRGAIALDAPLTGWPTDVTLLSLDVWDRFADLHYIEMPGPHPPTPHPRALSAGIGDQPPRQWALTTDVGTAHHGGAGGGGTPGTDVFLAFHSTVGPSLPDDAGVLHVHARAPGATGETSIDLSARPITSQHARVERPDGLADSDPHCSSCGPPLPAPPDPEEPPGPELDWAMPKPARPNHRQPDPRPTCIACRSNRQDAAAAKNPTCPRPDRVIAVGARLGPVFGADMFVPSVVAWPTWFDLTVAAHRGRTRTAFRRAPGCRWTAHDDHGRTYLGAMLSGGSGLGISREDISFVPALAPDATSLTVTLPASFDGTRPQATFDLTP